MNEFSDVCRGFVLEGPSIKRISRIKLEHPGVIRHEDSFGGLTCESLRFCWQRLCSCQHRLSPRLRLTPTLDRKSTRLNSSHSQISYAVFCLKKKKKKKN